MTAFTAVTAPEVLLSLTLPTLNTIPTTYDINPDFQKKKLGRFNKNNIFLPYKNIAKERLNMQLAILVGEIKKENDWKTEEKKSSRVASSVLIGVSGAGKTSRIFNNARQGYVLYCTAGDMVEDRDNYYLHFVELLKIQESQAHANSLMGVWILSKLLALLHLVSKYPELTPEQFLILQLNGRSEYFKDCFSQLYTTATKYNWIFAYSTAIKFLTQKIRERVTNKHIGIVFDEASIMENSFKDGKL